MLGQTIELPRINTGPFLFGTPKTAADSALSPLLPSSGIDHPKQRDFIESPAKRKVVVAGRRGGKTTGMAILASVAFRAGRRVLYAGPTSDQTERFWYAVRAYFESDIDSGRLMKSEVRRLIEYPNSHENAPRIRAKTAFNADTLRGDWGDLILLDEYSLMDGDVDEVVLPMLLDTNGDVVYGGTPKRKNHMFAKYVRAMTDDTGRWAHWHFTSHDNPHLSKEALEEISQDLTEDAYKQEIMAEFLDNEGAVFRNIGACMIRPSDPKDHEGHLLFAGIDWAKQNDYTVISIGCRECKKEVYLDRFNKIDYVFQRGRLQAARDKWALEMPMLPERNSIGEPNIEMLERDGLLIMNGPDNKPGFNMGATNKKPLIESLALVLERGEWGFIDDPIAKAELEAYEISVNPKTHHVSYSAPPGVHDDTVIARALMLQAINSYMPAFL